MATATKTKPVVKDIENRAFHEAHAITIRSAEKRSREAIIEAVTARWEVGEELDRVYGIPTRSRTGPKETPAEARERRRTVGTVSESHVSIGCIPSADLESLTAIYAPGRDTTGASARTLLSSIRAFYRKAQKHEIPEIVDTYRSWSSIERDYLRGREPKTTSRHDHARRKGTRDDAAGHRLAVVPPEVLEAGEAAGYEPEIIRKKCSEALAHLGWQTINALIPGN